jgi:hypothetical protein
MTDKKGLEAVKTLVEFCKSQRGCQNCIFRKHGAESWRCHIDAFDLQDVLSNIEAKKKNSGWI